ncbi:MAG: DNA (cytosine-5-)-methyltransferase [Nitrospinae bacterium]|nr:DNA (cytosine-5-)-methyltransferase [Nitrospinota bacterium]
MELRTVDLFAGGGGLSLGFANAGCKIVAAYDGWDKAVDLYAANFHGHPIFLRDLSDKNSPSEIKKFNPQIIIGGPPCQDFSSAGKRDEARGKADLTISFAEIVCTVHPQYFVMENVPLALNSKTLAEARKVFSKSGYGITAKVLDASYCGVPQKRKRLFVIGAVGAKDGFLESFLADGLTTKKTTMRDYFGKSLGVEHYYRHPRSYSRRGVFGMDEPSPTVRGVNRPVPKGYPGHPGDAAKIHGLRPLTTRERSMVQTFPKSFKLVGGATNVEQIIGNAVPVKLAEHVAKSLLAYIKK